MQIPRRFPDWQVPFVIFLLCALAAAWSDSARELLRYERQAAGEIWRFLTAHVVHLGYLHLALNLLGLGVVWLLVGRRFGHRQWYFVIVTCAVSVSVGLWWLDSDLDWYLGLSGVLHGMLAAGAVRGIRELPVESLAICAILAGKLAYEQFAGPLPGAASAGPVIVNAHLYGAAGGALCGLILYIMPAHSPPPDEEFS
ncbi:MAG: rhombosortase [Woeseiaceae bacterium]|nr:rhombosortase [Woeseiaceae bacterium]